MVGCVISLIAYRLKRVVQTVRTVEDASALIYCNGQEISLVVSPNFCTQAGNVGKQAATFTYSVGHRDSNQGRRDSVQRQLGPAPPVYLVGDHRSKLQN